MDFFINIAVLFCIYAILGLTLNLVVGYTGLLSVAHAAFFGVGAYSVAILTKFHNINFFIAVVVAMFLTSLLSILIGVVLSKFRHDYYALGSLGFNIIVVSILLNWDSLTRGPLGIAGIPKPELFGFRFGQPIHFLFLSLLFVVFVYWFTKFIVNSSYGRVLKAIREDEEALQVFGYNTHWFKLSIFVIGAGLAAISGGLLASYISFIDPHSFRLEESIFILSIIILGGLANLKGSIVGAAILIILPELLRFVGFPADIAAQMRQVVYGLILVLLMLYRPQGVLGEYKL